MVDCQPVSVDGFTLYPLFTDDLVHLMGTLIPAEHQSSVATSVWCGPLGGRGTRKSALTEEAGEATAWDTTEQEG